MEYKKDTLLEIEVVFNRVIQNNPDFKNHDALNFCYCFRDEKKLNTSGYSIQAQVSKFPVQIRDLFDKDVLVVICQETWNGMLPKDRERLAFHELCHISVKEGGLGNSEAKLDKHGRVAFDIVEHDIIIQTFDREVCEYGLTPDELSFFRNYVEEGDPDENSNVDIGASVGITITSPEKEIGETL